MSTNDLIDFYENRIKELENEPQNQETNQAGKPTCFSGWVVHISIHWI
jgi:hypothetical protein